MAIFAFPIVVAVVILASDAWVYWDARAQRDAGYPVQVSIGSFRVETAEAWFLGCLVLWVIFFPLYLTATNRNPFTRGA
jgi:hypothetical protein